MKRKPTMPARRPRDDDPYIMRIADLLSDDPALIGLLGPSFKVIVDYDQERKRVTYSFRSQDAPGDDDAEVV